VRTDQLARLLGRPVELAPTPLTGSYPRRMLRWEVAKGSVGAAVCLGIVLTLAPSPWIAVPLLAVGALFAAYVSQQVGRMPLRFSLDDTSVTRIRGAQRTPLRWSELEELRLNYYPNGRKAAMGMLVLLLRNHQGRLKVDSSLDHFPTLLSRAAGAARERGLTLHPTTAANLDKLGL
jgi:hypothetical protein